jgi:PAS domain S-box-containing protein
MSGAEQPKASSAAQSVRKFGGSPNSRQSSEFKPSLEEQLRESELKYRTLVETLPHVVIIVEHGKIVFANETASQFLGCKQPEYLVGRDPAEFVADSEKDRVREYLHRGSVRNPGLAEQFETLARHLSGQEIPVEVRVKTFGPCGRMAYQMVITDLSRRRHIDARLRLFTGALERIAEGMALVDLEDRLLFLNQHFATMYGYGVGELVSKHLAILCPPEQFFSLAAASEQVRRSGVFTGELVHSRKDGSLLPVLSTMSLIRDDGGFPVGMIITVRDISEFKLAEEIYIHSVKKFQQLKVGLEDQLREAAKQLEDSQSGQKHYTKLLEQTNEALNMVIAETENRNREREQAVYRNLSTNVLPIVDQLKSERLADSLKPLLDSLEFNLKSLFSVASRILSQEMIRLTPRETRLCELIRSGLTSKQIADAMGISAATVVVHRANIRKKLGLVGSDDNLATFLRTRL